METREVFDASPLSVAQFLNEPGQGLYIPPYQRTYNWDSTKVKRLMEDVGHGLQQLGTAEDSICFLGSIIALKDINYVTVSPLFRPQVPARVMTIIDGQQRITTLLILLTVLHEEIRKQSRQIKGDGVAEGWSRNQAADLLAKLASTFQEDMNYGSGDYRYYPRMIRAYVDGWSRQDDEALYTSAIARYLFEYSRHARNQDVKSDFVFEIEAQNGADESPAQNDLDSLRYLKKIRDFIRKTLRSELSGGRTDDDENEVVLAATESIRTSSILQEALFNSKVPDEVFSAIQEGNNYIKGTLRLAVFANYVLRRVTVAVVTAKKEEYGFDMFEALNTTGEPLTALETFKPRVIQRVDLKDWKESREKHEFDRIENYLGSVSGASSQKRQNSTGDLLISFALMWDGSKLGKRLSEQRTYLRGTYDGLSSPSEQEYVATLGQFVRFIEGPWKDFGSVDLGETSEKLDSAIFSVGVLKAGKHDIVMPLLARYYAAFRLSDSDGADQARSDFLDACCACLAFYGLWRAPQRGTAGIDNVYRALMAGRDASPGWCVSKQGSLSTVPSIGSLREQLWKQLQSKGYGEKEKWVRGVARNALAAGNQQVLTRLILFAASNDAIEDPDGSGLSSRGRPGVLDMMNIKTWDSDTVKTVEHTAPQNQDGSWSRELYEDPDTVHSIGNLTLLPARENSSASNGSWERKRLFYQVLSAPTIEAAETLIADAQEKGLSLTGAATEIAKEAKYLPLVAAIGHRQEDWTREFVYERGERLASMAWDTLLPWLKSDWSTQV